MVGLVIGLFIASPYITFTMLLSISVLYISAVLVIKSPLTKLSFKTADMVNQLQRFYSEAYDNLTRSGCLERKAWYEIVNSRFTNLAIYQRNTAMWAESPRNIIEMFTVIVIILIIFLISTIMLML